MTFSQIILAGNSASSKNMRFWLVRCQSKEACEFWALFLRRLRRPQSRFALASNTRTSVGYGKIAFGHFFPKKFPTYGPRSTVCAQPNEPIIIESSAARFQRRCVLGHRRCWPNGMDQSISMKLFSQLKQFFGKANLMVSNVKKSQYQ